MVNRRSERKDVTGHDAYIIVEALTFAVEALSKLPIEFRPTDNIEDMKRLIEELIKEDAAVAKLQMIAQQRLAALVAHVRRWDRP
jgi:hypothetical protein